MSAITVDKNLTPGDKVILRIEMSFFGYSKTFEFPDIFIPNAAPLLSRTEGIVLTSSLGPDKPRTKGNYTFTKYAKKENLPKGFYRLKLYMSQVKQANQLVPGEEVTFTSSDPKLAQLNGKTFKVITTQPKKSADEERYVDLMVQNTFVPTVNSSTANGTLSEITGVTKTKKYTVTIPQDIIDKGLITKTKRGLNIKDGDVEDIPIFAYKRYKGKNTANISKKLMMNHDTVNESTPPDRSVVDNEYRGKPSYPTIFEINDKEKFIFYVAIARYIYNAETNSWSKEWLQTDLSDKAIWGKAVEKSAK